MPKTRQLAAIMFTDIVGYTALMGNDEHKAFELLNKNRLIHKPIIEQFNGRFIKELGDGVMASFTTVSDAVTAAIKIQEACNLAKDFQLRIGINLGEVVFENEDIFGDGVNIAARIQAAAKPGCIYISESVNQNVANKKDIQTQFTKEEILKNVKEPVKMYEVLLENTVILIPEKTLKTTPASPKKEIIIENSIAVLPFANMSSDPEQEFFSDGISEDIINMLAQVPGLKVTGRTSSFAFKGKNQDLRVIGELLNVNHILEGSVRKAGNKLRITAQLITVSDGFHLYSEKFDRELEDIFDIQDEISLAILNAIKIKLFGEAKEGVLKKYTDNIDAWQLYLQGRFYYDKFDSDGFTKAMTYFEAAIKLEPNYAIAYSGMANIYHNLMYFGFLSTEQGLPLMKRAIEQSLQIDNELAEAYISLAMMQYYNEWNFAEAVISFKKAIELNPNLAEAHVRYALCLIILGKNSAAIEQVEIAYRLEPFSLMNIFNTAITYLNVGDFEKTLEYARLLIEMEPNFFGGYAMTASAFEGLGRYEEAILEFELAVQLNYGTYTLHGLGYAYGILGKKEKATEVIKKLKAFENSASATDFYIGIVYVIIGAFDTAFPYFEKALKNHESPMVFIKLYLPFVPAFAQDPRTAVLLEKMGL